MIEKLFYLLLLLAGFPTGLLLAKLCKEELKQWRKRLLVMSIISTIFILLLSFLKFEYKFPATISLFFIIIVCLTIIWKSKR